MPGVGALAGHRRAGEGRRRRNGNRGRRKLGLEVEHCGLLEVFESCASRKAGLQDARDFALPVRHRLRSRPSRRIIKMPEPRAARKSQGRMKSMHETHFRKLPRTRILSAH